MATAAAHPKFNLISSEHVVGAKIYDPGGKEIGEIDHLMIDKISGHARYAVVNFCGFMCLRPGHHPLPWNALKYDKEREGYLANVTEKLLRLRPISATIAGWIGNGRCGCISTTRRTPIGRKVQRYRRAVSRFGGNSSNATLEVGGAADGRSAPRARGADQRATTKLNAGSAGRRGE